MERVNWKIAIQIENEVQKIIHEQEENGCYFNTEKAIQYVSYIEKKRKEIYDKVIPLLRPIVDHSKATVGKPFTSKGELCIRARNCITDTSSISGPFSPVSFLIPNMGSRKQLMDQLKHHGWKATQWTDKGNERLTEDSLKVLKGELGKEISEWYILKHRQSQIESLLKKVRPDHRISAIANTIGTPTGRMRHSVIVNIPRADPSSIFGYEMRSLFCVPKGKVLIGYDASGIEARMLAHYMNDPDLIEEILEGDFHTKVWNPIKTWVNTRGNAKNIEYAIIYGAGNEKIGKMCDNNPKKLSLISLGKRVRSCIMHEIPALNDLTNNVKIKSKKGYLIGLDGRKLIVRSEHSSLNTLLQGAGAVVMKVSMIILEKSLIKEGIKNDVKKVIDMHDESQAEVTNDKDIIELYQRLAVQSIKKSGEYFKLKCPLDAESKVGNNWAETH